MEDTLLVSLRLHQKTLCRKSNKMESTSTSEEGVGVEVWYLRGRRVREAVLLKYATRYKGSFGSVAILRHSLSDATLPQECLARHFRGWNYRHHLFCL